VLQSGDTIRIGDTTFTFELRGVQYGSSYSDGSTVLATPPPPPNFAGNTNYGMGNMYGSNQPGNDMTIPATPPSYIPPNNAYLDQQSSNPPPPPSYVSQTQTPTYIPPSNAQYGQQPMYTPSPVQPQKRSPLLAIVVAVVSIVVILGGLGSFLLFQNNQNQQHTQATATANTLANNTATALARQNATATAIASATAFVTSHFPPFTTLSFHDPLNTKSNSNWSAGSACLPGSNGYQVSIAQVNNFEYCTYLPKTFGDSAYQATMNIQQGDCGGLIFRYIDSHNLFIFEVCQNGTYNLEDKVNNQWFLLYTNNHASAAIQQGLNKQNVLAVTVQGDTVNMYVNGQKIDTATIQVMTNSQYTQGSIALEADDYNNPTTVIYTDAMLWTQ
jgi:hypothetical protein